LGAHEEDVFITAKLNAFANATATLLVERPAPAPRAPVVAEPEEVYEEDVLLENDFTKHHVRGTDTLQGLALKYNSTIDRLKKANKIFSGDQICLKYVYIPSKLSKIEDSPVYLRKPKPKTTPNIERLADRFMTETQCTLDEAVYYITNTDGNYEVSLNQYHQDLAWSKKSKSPQYVSKYGSIQRFPRALNEVL